MPGMRMPGPIRVDFAWFWELALLALSWVLLYRGQFWRRGRKELLRACTEFAVLAAVLGGCNLGGRALSVVVSRNIFMPLWMVVRGLVPAGYAVLCSPYRRRTSALLWCSMLAAVLGIGSIGGQFSFLVNEFVAQGAIEGVVRGAVNLLIPAMALYLNAFNFDDYESIPKSGTALILAGDVSVIAIFALESLWAGADYRVTATLAVSYICLFAMIVFAVYAMYAMCREQAKVITLQAEQQRSAAEREMLRMSEAAASDLRAVRHDLKNHFAFMKILLEEERYAELKDYFQGVAQNLPAPITFINCGNKTVDTILNMEMAKAKKLDVPVEHKLAIPPQLPFSEDDLCAILANLMDNAIEECVRLKEEGKAADISIEISRRGSYLYITCRNTTDLERLTRHDRGLRTTKGDSRIHGYGTRIIIRKAEKYNGCAEYELKNGQFVASVMLDLSAEEESA